MKNKKGFVFIETIIVTCILLASLMVIYSLYVNSLNVESRYLKYDDPVKLYETYYISKYLESFDFKLLKENIKNGAKYERIFLSRSDIFGGSYTKEVKFLEDLWAKLHIKSMYLFPHNIKDLAECNSYESNDKVFKDAICTNTNLITYLRNIDDVEPNKYVFVVEFASTKGGDKCSSRDCFHYYAHLEVGD